MIRSLRSSPTEMGIPIKHFMLSICIIGVFMGSVLLAKGCVKTPDLEPTPGISPKVIVGVEW